jgi:serine/threonine protein kinase
MGKSASPATKDDFFQFEGRLPGGSNSQLFLVRQISSGELGVAKVLTGNERRSNEIEMLTQVAGAPNVPVLFAVEQDSMYQQFVMSHHPGKTLEQLILEAPKRGGLPAPRVARIGLGVAKALQGVHAKGVVHGDVKPLNVIVAEDASVTLIDFDSAKFTGESVVDEDLQLVATPYLVPPEAIHASADPKADSYALGVMLFYARYGTLPLHHATDMADIEDQFQNGIHTDRSWVRDELDEVIANLTHEDPLQRWSVEDALQPLQRLTERDRVFHGGRARMDAVVLADVPTAFVQMDQLAHLNRNIPSGRAQVAEGADLSI